MADLPPGMMTLDRKEDQNFDENERLFRRFSPEDIEDGEISIAMVELPDMSCIREKYGRPEWLLLDHDFRGWGVLFFQVKDIPPNQEIIQASMKFTLQARHVPQRYNYPHSEVWVYHEGVHVCVQDRNLHLLDPDFHLRWRARLAFVSRIALVPVNSLN